jgi:hypothetical protein
MDAVYDGHSQRMLPWSSCGTIRFSARNDWSLWNGFAQDPIARVKYVIALARIETRVKPTGSIVRDAVSPISGE